MTEILTALATSAGVLLPVVIFIVIASIVAVRRGEAGSHHAHTAAEVVHHGAPQAVAATAPPRELSVMEILLLAVALFAVAMLALLGVSMLGHI